MDVYHRRPLDPTYGPPQGIIHQVDENIAKWQKKNNIPSYPKMDIYHRNPLAPTQWSPPGSFPQEDKHVTKWQKKNKIPSYPKVDMYHRKPLSPTHGLPPGSWPEDEGPDCSSYKPQKPFQFERRDLHVPGAWVEEPDISTWRPSSKRPNIRQYPRGHISHTQDFESVIHFIHHRASPYSG